MKKIFGKLLGKYLKRRIKLEEGPMTETKKWWKSKGVWTGIITVLIGLYGSIDASLGPQFGFDLPPIPDWFFALLGSMGVYARLDAKKQIK